MKNSVNPHESHPLRQRAILRSLREQRSLIIDVAERGAAGPEKN
ncbi:hypothetical protein [Cupriavidus taiwanensis]|nr:hypothetical protein [Cupriavidus taiwanensis]